MTILIISVDDLDINFLERKKMTSNNCYFYTEPEKQAMYLEFISDEALTLEVMAKIKDLPADVLFYILLRGEKITERQSMEGNDVE